MKGETYEEFVEKFKPKKTTDDCYTPPAVYEVVKEWALSHMEGIDGLEVCRPFYPGGDYEAEDYTGKVVIDNPPFSILAQIKRYYVERNIPFFLFSPTLTLFSTNLDELCYICASAEIIYTNGACVCTSFVTNSIPDIRAMTAPGLTAAIEAACGRHKKQLPRYTYPAHVLTSMRMGRLKNIPFEIYAHEAEHIRVLDDQRRVKKAIYGHGLLLGDGAAARLRNAEERYETEMIRNVEWELSDREKKIIRRLSE